MPELVDLDGDGDIDLIFGQYYPGMVYYENTGSATNPSFTLNTTLFSNAQTPQAYESSPSFVDLDMSGDLDLMLAQETTASVQ